MRIRLKVRIMRKIMRWLRVRITELEIVLLVTAKGLRLYEDKKEDHDDVQDEVNLMINSKSILCGSACLHLAWASLTPPWLPHVPQTRVRKNFSKKFETGFFCSKSCLLQPPIYLHHQLPAPLLLRDALSLLGEKAGERKEKD